MGSAATFLLGALLSSGVTVTATAGPADERPLEVGRPRSMARPAEQQPGQHHWRVAVVEQQWIALMLVADAATSWSVDTGGATRIEGCGDDGCRWIVVAANPGDTLAVEITWSAQAAGEYVLAAAQPPSHLSGAQAPAMREIYTLADVEDRLRADAAPDAAARVRGHLLDRLGALSVAEPLSAADVAAVIGRRRLLSGRSDDTVALVRQTLQQLDPDDDRLVGAWFALRGLEGNALMSLGDYAPARQAFLQIGKVGERFNVPSIALNVSQSLATLDLLAGRPVQAAEALSQLLTAPALRDRPADRLALLASLGNAWESAGDLGRAESAFEQALMLDPDAAIEAQMRVNLGRVLRRQGRDEEALEQFERAIENAASESRQARAGALTGLAELHKAAGRRAEARSAAEQALALFEAESPQGEFSLTALQPLAEIALAEGDADRARALIEQAHAVLDRSSLAGLAILQATGVRSRFAQWSEIRQDLVALELSQPAAAAQAIALATTTAAGFLESGRWKARAIYQRVAEEPPTVSWPAPGVSDLLSELGLLLGDDRALIEYAAGSERLYAYRLYRGVLSFHDLGPRGDLGRDVSAYVQQLMDVAAGSPQRLLHSGQALYERLIVPLQLPHDLTVLSIVPDHSLADLPFEALVSGADAATNEALGYDDLHYLLDDVSVLYAPSSAVLAAASLREPRTTDGRALLFGDVLLPAESGASVAGVGALRRLPATGLELRSLAGRLSRQSGAGFEEQGRLAASADQRSVDISAPGFDLYLGSAAHGGRWQGDLGGYSMLHIATHGVIDARDPRRSGLVLSHAPGGDALLTLQEMRALALRAELVVLSACDTAQGRLLAGEGVQSMAHAFLEGGARTVVASLWPVLDRDALAVMTMFHELRLGDDLSAAEALTLAKRNSRRAQRTRGKRIGAAPPSAGAGHPYYWASFVCIGGRAPLPDAADSSGSTPDGPR